MDTRQPLKVAPQRRQLRGAQYSRLLAFAMLVSNGCWRVGGHPRQTASAAFTSELRGEDAVEAILRITDSVPIVAIGDVHEVAELGAFRLRLLRDSRLPAHVQDIVIEGGNSLYQAVADRFVNGEPVSDDSLRLIWNNTTQSPFNTLDVPTYAEDVLRTVRDVNGSLPASRRLRVLLADPDSNNGSVAFLMGTTSEFSFSDVASNRERLDRTLWRAMVPGDGTRLDVLSSPGDLAGGGLTGESVQQVLSFARPLYDWMVVDLGRLQSLSAGVLPLLTDVILVTTASIPALYEAKQVVGHFTHHDPERERLRLVINHAEKTDVLDTCDLEKLFGAPVFARIPNDRDSIQSALLRKQLPEETSNIREHVRRIAQILSGIQETKSKPKGAIPQMFSFLKGKRERPRHAS